MWPGATRTNPLPRAGKPRRAIGAMRRNFGESEAKSSAEIGGRSTDGSQAVFRKVLSIRRLYNIGYLKTKRRLLVFT